MQVAFVWMHLGSCQPRAASELSLSVLWKTASSYKVELRHKAYIMQGQCNPMARLASRKAEAIEMYGLSETFGLWHVSKSMDTLAQ